MLGGDEIYVALSDELGVGENQTTADGTITLEHAECLAGCDYAPVVTVNYEFFDNQTVVSAVGLVRQLRTGERPLPSRGAPLCTCVSRTRSPATRLSACSTAAGARRSAQARTIHSILTFPATPCRSARSAR
jgi:Thioredoxin-like [2Fe-2S] ferredoxin